MPDSDPTMSDSDPTTSASEPMVSDSQPMVSDVEPTITIPVEEGDTLESLAEFYYQDVTQWEAIQQVNPTLQGKELNDALPTGTQVTLPRRGGVRYAFLYRTRAHDTMRGLAHSFYHDDNRWPIIRNANLPELKSYGPDDILPVGLIIRIP